MFKAVGLTISNRRRFATVAIVGRKADQATAWRASLARKLQTESDASSYQIETTRSAPRLGALRRLDGAALRRLERRHSAEAPTPSQWERLNPKDKKCHLDRMTEVAAAK